MRAVRPASPTERIVHLQMSSNELVRLEDLGIGVSLGVLKQAEDELEALLRPAPDGRRHVLALLVALDAELKAHEGGDLLLLDDVVEVRLRAGKRLLPPPANTFPSLS